jgi:hypothetical protein
MSGFDPVGSIPDWVWLAGVIAIMIGLVFWMILKRLGISIE